MKIITRLASAQLQNSELRCLAELGKWKLTFCVGGDCGRMPAEIRAPAGAIYGSPAVEPRSGGLSRRRLAEAGNPGETEETNRNPG